MIKTRTRHERDGMVYYTVPSFDETGKVHHLFSTAVGGMDAGIYSAADRAKVAADYGRLCRAAGLAEESLVLTRQVHSNIINVAGRLDRGLDAPGAFLPADGSITDKRGYTLVKLTADCVPILLFDPVRDAIAAVHAGWRGTAGHIAARAVKAMVSLYGCRAENILCAIGPHICADCYEIDQKVMDIFDEAYAGQRCCRQSRPQHYLISLAEYNALDLTGAGVRDDHITDTGLCTLEDEELHSYRRSGAAAGRLGAFIGLK